MWLEALGSGVSNLSPYCFIYRNLVFSDRFLGDQRASYNQDITFKLRIGENGPVPTIEDVVLEGAGLSITQPIFGQQNPLPAIHVRYSVQYVFFKNRKKERKKKQPDRWDVDILLTKWSF